MSLTGDSFDDRGGQVTRPASVVEAFTRNAERSPDKLCLRFEGEDWSYGRLLDRAGSFAAALRAWGLKPGDRVALFLRNHPDFLAAYLGTHLARGVTVPVNKSYRRTELRHIFEDAGVRLCVADREGRPELEGVCGDLPSLERVVVRGDDFDTFLEGAGALDAPAPGGDDLAMISYTSGTTGRSKGAMLLHRNLLANVEAIREAWRWTSDDHLLLTLPLFHTHGLTVGAHGTLLTGASVDLRRAFDAAEVYDASLTGDFTMFFGVPTMYTRLFRETAVPRSRLPCGSTSREALL
jgi:malonyl-CoA/methylmalonyl-CoA synthetase